MTPFEKRLTAALEKVARDDVKASAEKYFVGATKFIGVKNPVTRALALRHLKEAPPTDMVAEALSLLRSPYFELRLAGIAILEKKRRTLNDDVIDALAQIFDEHVNEWATCDTLCGGVLREMVKRGPKTKKRVMAWSRAKSPWRQRAAAVAFVNEARHGGYDDDVIAVCTRIVKNPHRFVQLGCGWVLRELSLVDRPRVIAFIEAHAAELSREGLRYAVEKMPKAVRADVMARHSRARTR